MNFRVFFFFSCLFVLPSFNVQTDDDNLPKHHHIESNPGGGVCGGVGEGGGGRGANGVFVASMDVDAMLLHRRSSNVV